MPLTISSANAERLTVEEWNEQQWAEHIKAHGANLKAFGNKLSKLAEDHRDELERWLYDGWLHDVQKFLDERQPGQSAHEWLKIDEQEKRLSELHDEWNEIRAKARKLPDETIGKSQMYLDALHFDTWKIKPAQEKLLGDRQHAKWLTAFVVRDAPDTAKLHREAKAHADSSLEQFVSKTKDKVAGFLVGRKHTIGDVVGRIKDGTLEGDVSIKFADGSSFRLNVFLRWQPMQNGRGCFAQYPLYFRDVTIGRKDHGTVAEVALYRLLGIKRWEPPPMPKPKAARISTGDVIATVSHPLALVLRTDQRKNVAKVYLPEGKEATIGPQDVAGVLASEWRSPWHGVYWKINGRKMKLHPEGDFGHLGNDMNGLRKAALDQYRCLFAKRKNRKAISEHVRRLGVAAAKAHQARWKREEIMQEIADLEELKT